MRRSELHFYSFAKNFHKEDKFIYIICNLDKLKKSDVAPVEEENERDETYQGSNTCIDNSRTYQNYHTVYPQGKYLDVIEDRISGLNLKRKVRSDAVYMCSFVLTASPEFFKVSTPNNWWSKGILLHITVDPPPHFCRFWGISSLKLTA